MNFMSLSMSIEEKFLLTGNLLIILGGFCISIGGLLKLANAGSLTENHHFAPGTFGNFGGSPAATNSPKTKHYFEL